MSTILKYVSMAICLACFAAFAAFDVPKWIIVVSVVIYIGGWFTGMFSAIERTSE